MKKMKKKTKLLALLEIAIVLCSVFLVALPGIAAEQTTQELRAAEVTKASEDDYVLGIYGNANEDDTIDMRDLTYEKLIFFGKKPETELADAKYDGKINPLDFIQIKLIIVGKEKELTFVQYLGTPSDFTEEPVTVKKPIERIVAIGGSYSSETLCAFEEQDKIVGVSKFASRRAELKPCLNGKTVLGGGWSGWDMEKIIELRPDLVLSWSSIENPEYKKQLDVAGISLVLMDFYKPIKHSREIRNLGWLLSKQKRAEELIEFEQQHMNIIKERLEDLKPEQKPRVYFEFGDYDTVGTGSSWHDSIIKCGGIDIFADSSTGSTKIDPEAVIERNPQVILKILWGVPHGYDTVDTGPIEEMRNNIMSRPGWDHIDAVKNERVYLISCDTESTHSCIHSSYIAKWLHSDKFLDIDPVDIHKEWFEKFLGIEYKGLFVYPPLEE